MNRFFLAVSTVFSPILVPTYGFILAMGLTVLNFLPLATRLATTGMIFLITAVVPAAAIWLMYHYGLVSDPSLSQRNERTAPYAVSCVCYLAAIFYLYKVSAPTWLWMFLVAAFVALIINVIVTRWWKISAHMTAMGGLIGLLCRLQADTLATVNMTWWIAAAVLMTGLVGMARIYRERHDIWQVLAGTACGFICVYFMTMITF